MHRSLNSKSTEESSFRLINAHREVRITRSAGSFIAGGNGEPFGRVSERVGFALSLRSCTLKAAQSKTWIAHRLRRKGESRGSWKRAKCFQRPLESGEMLPKWRMAGKKKRGLKRQNRYDIFGDKYMKPRRERERESADWVALSIV